MLSRRGEGIHSVRGNMGHSVWKRGGSPHHGGNPVRGRGMWVTLSIVGVGVGEWVTLSGRGERCSTVYGPRWTTPPPL